MVSSIIGLIFCSSCFFIATKKGGPNPPFFFSSDINSSLKHKSVKNTAYSSKKSSKLSTIFTKNLFLYEKNASSKCQRRSSNHRGSLAWTKITGFKCGRFASNSDRVKETLFNWLMPYIVDSHCLDCFAGSGSLGFEALSRQAKQVNVFRVR